MHAENRHLGWPEDGIFVLFMFYIATQLLKVQEIREANRNI